MEKISLKDHIKENQLFIARTGIAFFVIVAVLLVLLGQMLYLQHYGHHHYTKLSNKNRIDIVPLGPTRGLIYDRNGTLLAQNQSVHSLELIPDKIKDIESTIESLKTIIPMSERDYARFQKQFKQKRRFEKVQLRTELTEEEIALFAVNRHRFPGVDIEANLIRHYPLGESMSHILGYVAQISPEDLLTLDTTNYPGTHIIGKVGIERYYESILLGQVGHEHLETDARGRTIRSLQYQAPKAGKNLTLTIDAPLQAEAMRMLKGIRGAIVAIEPKTGAILALASNPSFDNNLFSRGIDAKLYQELQNSPDRPLFNRAIRGRYPPGSTIKPFFGVLGLESDAVTPGYSIHDPGYYQINGGGRKYRDWKRTGHGRVNLETAIVRSCDTYFYNLAYKLGIDAIHDYLDQFGLGKLTGVDLIGESSGILPSPDWKRGAKGQPWYPGETVITGIGQGFMLVTPIQLAAATSILANNGRVIKPHLLKTSQIPGQGILPYQPELLHTIPTRHSNTWELINEAMHKTVQTSAGTAWRIGQNAEYSIAGKTGTAQVFSLAEGEKYDASKLEERLRDHALFISFAPVEDPKIAVAVVLENAGSGAALAPARDIMDFYLLGKPYVAHTEEGAEE